MTSREQASFPALLQATFICCAAVVHQADVRCQVRQLSMGARHLLSTLIDSSPTIRIYWSSHGYPALATGSESRPCAELSAHHMLHVGPLQAAHRPGDADSAGPQLPAVCGGRAADVERDHHQPALVAQVAAHAFRQVCGHRAYGHDEGDNPPLLSFSSNAS